MTRRHLAVLLVVLTSCTENTVKPTLPTVVRVQVPQYVPLPEALTRPCPAVRAKGRTVEAVVSAYNANVPTQTDCDRRMARIRALQPGVGQP
ncbi:hypothetical protein [Xanthomonas oryzae]|uniref:Rz1-like lysis system protein LysC n=1 Tax=Xanthomonas oryzae TaxID=347 RepID=UPI000C7AE407|nr:hypothetical protein [Xanthomonas oryzae]AUJ13410.1 hypothetical protein BVV20_16435 [Xanthomonas oryzae pv. oryzae]QBG87529.1 hypothetical protein EYC54_06895 [Xanthomonas oryzae]